MKPTILALVGPTGVGKTKTALRICHEVGAEVISMDSMQVYCGMDIGTAKPTKTELESVPHHMIDVVEPDCRFTTSMYKEMASRAIEDVLSRGKMPLLVGGTGLYLQAIQYDMSLGEQGADQKLRDDLQRIADEPDGLQRLHARLAEVDPETAKKLHPNDVRRVIRALEIYEVSGKTKSERADAPHQEGPYRVLVYGLSLPREQMYARINLRVDQMMEQGLVDEVQGLLARGIVPSPDGGAMQAIGYKEIVSALRGEIAMDEAVRLIKQGSRRYAKRQWTWFRKDPHTRWFDWSEYPDEEGLIRAVLNSIFLDLS